MTGCQRNELHAHVYGDRAVSVQQSQLIEYAECMSPDAGGEGCF